MQNRTLWLLIAFSGFCAVACGAFGAHSLAGKLEIQQLTVWNKAVSYQFYHTLAAAMALLMPFKSKHPAIFFLLGVLLFSGSLYLLACKDLLGWQAGWLGPVTPLGGLLFLCGWTAVFLEVLQSKKKNT